MMIQASVVFDDPCVGLEGHVTKIDERNNSLRVCISGSYWPAKKARSCFLVVASRIKVIARHGITLIIEPA